MTKRDAETVLQAHGVPATAVYSPTEILASPQLAHREAFEDLVLEDGRTAQVVGLPFRIVAGGNGDGDRRRVRRSLRGLRMLEASRVLAVPLCGALLGSLGAEVTKLEDLPRLDMYRRRGPYIDGEPGGERSAYFALMNHSKSSAGFDVDGDRGRLDDLVAGVDVVIENLGRKRAHALRLGASTAPEDHVDLLAISSSGFGQDGPHADYRAYAYNLQASAALGYLTTNAEGDHAEIDIAWADLVSAYALATIVAAWAIGPAGNAGTGVDFAMADLTVSHFNEHLAAASLGCDDDADRANELAPYSPNGVYPTLDGWIAISVWTDDQLALLAQVLDDDGLMERRDDLDARVAAATTSHDATELATTLRGLGVAAEAVVDAADLVADEQLAARGFFVPVRHPVWGERHLVGIPWRPRDGAPIPLRPPPRLGEEA
jgi:crotonobetainyl-CoA:carnitine CoA-transferase CaiB-like acyl-CoA transferase